MAQIPRPPKQGNVLTYVAKVAAGYPHILAGEMDADLDTIYGAWNSGADTVNIRDGAVTSAKLAADSVGPRELQDSGVGTANLADASVTTPKITDGAVTAAKLAPGAVGGAALGTDSVGAGQIVDGSVGTAELGPGAVTAEKLAAGAVGAREIADGSIGTVELGDVQVTRAKLAVNAANGARVSGVPPSGFVLSTAGVWTTYATLPTLTTRGGAVLLFANPGTVVNAQANAQPCSARWLRDGTFVVQGGWPIVGSGGLLIPMPGVHGVDTAAPAGAHVYVYQVFAGINATVTSANTADGSFLAMEIG